MALGRAWKWVFGVSGLLLALILLLFSSAIGLIAWPSGSENVGLYRISSYRREGMGHTGHERTLYLRRRFWDYRITNALAQYDISPNHPEKLIFGSWDCDYGTDTPNCGTFLFDASTRQRWKIAGARKDYSDPLWSSDGRFVVLVFNFDQEVALIDLQNGRVTRVAVLQDSEKPPFHSVHFVGWSPDQHKAEVDVSDTWGAGPEARYEYDVYCLDPSTSKVTYVGSSVAWDDAAFVWQANGNRYELLPDSHNDAGARVFHKPPEEVMSF
jgi:hypothetical protein